MAGTNGVVQGKNCVFQVNLGSGFYSVVCTKGFGVSIDTELKETTSKGSGVFKEFAAKSLSYRVNATGLIKVIDLNSDPTYFDLIDFQKQFIEVPYRFIWADDNNVIKRFSGVGIIASATLNASAGQLADATLDIQGTGEYFLENDVSLGCSNTITALNINGVSYPAGSTRAIPNGDDVTISITTLANSLLQIFRYDYEIDGGGKNSAFTDGSLPYEIATIEFGGYSVGAHTLTITPVCENGFDGTVTTVKLNKLSPL